jgi:hypothetical protein
MLRFRIAGKDNPRACSGSATGWRTLESWVEPLRVPALEDFALRTEDRLLIVVRERVSSARIERGSDRFGPIRGATQQELTILSMEARSGGLSSGNELVYLA